MIRSVFVPLTLPECEKVIAACDTVKLGMELTPIPAMGGCVIAIREIVHTEETKPTRLRLPGVERLNDIRREIRLRSVLRTLAPVTGGDA